MPRYNVEYPISGLMIDDKARRVTGGTIEIAEAVAAPLLAVGALSGPIAAPELPPAKPGSEGMSGDASASSEPSGAPAIDAAPEDASPQQPLRDHLAAIKAEGGKKPRVADVREALGSDVITGDDVSAIWRELGEA